MLKKFYMALITILCSLGITIAISYAWFLNDTNVDPIAQGMAGTAYFAYGDGSSDKKAYGINSPRHLYNLAWLSYLYPDQYANKYYEIDPSLKVSLNMDGWTLPPIGKDNLPFTGFFNGNGKTIEKLTVSNDISSMRVKPNADSIPDAELNGTMLKNATSIGFFGNISGDGTTQVHDFYLDNAKIETKASSTCAGIVAGYVDGKIENVGVISSGLDLGNTAHSATHGSNVSDYTVVGYAEDEYKTLIANRHTIIYNPNTSYTHFNYIGMGNGDAFGGSIDMQKLYNRIKSANPKTPTVTGYTNAELRYEGFQTTDGKTTRTTTANNNQRAYKDFGDARGTYIKNTSVDDKYQAITALYKNVTIVTKTEATENGNTINSNNYFLNISSTYTNNLNFTVTLSANTANGSVWCEESSNGGVKLYTYNDDDGYKYYLVGNTNLSVTISNNASNGSIWHWTNNAYYTSINGVDYSLKYFNSAWTLRNTYVIGDGNGHYLKNNNNAVANANSINDATLFAFSIEGTYPSGTITASNGAYLRNNAAGTLSFGTNNSYNVWSNENGQLYNTRSNINYYLQYDNAWTLKQPTTYYIVYEGNYLYLNNSGQIQTSGTTNINEATAFTISNALINGTGTGTISATIGNQIYYLRYNNYNTFDTSTGTGTYTTWSYDGYGFYQTNNQADYYILFKNNSWTIDSISTITTNYFSIGYTYDNKEYYLNATTTAVSASTSTYSIWYVDNNNYVYTVIDGTNYYLYIRRSYGTDYLSVSTITTETYMITRYNDSLRYYRNSYKYIRYNGSYNGSISTNNTTQYDWNWDNNWYDYDNTPLGNVIMKGINPLSIQKSQLLRTSSTINKYTRTTGIKEPSLFTCIPINAQATNPYEVEENNTGYIISGGHEPSETNADIRVSQFTQKAGTGSGIAGSFTNSSHTWNNNSIYTINTNGMAFIADNASAPSGSYDKSIFNNYESSRNTLQTTLTNSGNYVYGLHFMDSKISKNKYVVADEVYINDDSGNKTKTNYQMLEDCIDFNLKSKGYITVYSGYYFNGTGGINNSFFSLNEVLRDSNGRITEVRHILNVYRRTEDNVFIYKYQDCDSTTVGYYYYDTESNVYVNVNQSDLFDGNTLKSGYELKFDYNWVEHPVNYGGTNYTDTSETYVQRFFDSYQTYVFYFEIPVNRGEYAIGSVEGGVGTYLMYLDIGANASFVDRTEITQTTQKLDYEFEYVNGIQVLQSNTEVAINAINAANSVSVIVKTTTTSSVVLNKTNGTTISIENSSGTPLTLTSSYVGNNIQTFNGDLSEVPKEIETTKVLKLIDYNNGDGKLYRTTIVKVGNADPTSAVHQIDKTDIATNLNLYDTTVNPVPDADKYGLLRRGTSADTGKEGYGVEATAADLLNRATFRSIPADNDNNYYDSSPTDNSNKLLEYYCQVSPKTTQNLNAISESISMTVAEISDGRRINGIQIANAVAKITESDGYALQHVYRMTGDTITISSTALASIINSNVKILVYVPTLIEQTGDTNPQYVFVINGTNVTAVNQTIAVTNGA